MKEITAYEFEVCGALHTSEEDADLHEAECRWLKKLLDHAKHAGASFEKEFREFLFTEDGDVRLTLTIILEALCLLESDQ